MLGYCRARSRLHCRARIRGCKSNLSYYSLQSCRATLRCRTLIQESEISVRFGVWLALAGSVVSQCVLGSDQNFGSVRDSAGFGQFGSVRFGKKKSEVWFGFGKNSWFGRFLVYNSININNFIKKSIV